MFKSVLFFLLHLSFFHDFKDLASAAKYDSDWSMDPSKQLRAMKV